MEAEDDPLIPEERKDEIFNENYESPCTCCVACETTFVICLIVGTIVSLLVVGSLCIYDSSVGNQTRTCGPLGFTSGLITLSTGSALLLLVVIFCICLNCYACYGKKHSKPPIIAFYSNSLPFSKIEASIYGDHVFAIEEINLSDVLQGFSLIKNINGYYIWVSCHDDQVVEIFETIARESDRSRVHALVLNCCYSRFARNNCVSVQTVPIISFDEVSYPVDDRNAFVSSLLLYGVLCLQMPFYKREYAMELPQIVESILFHDQRATDDPLTRSPAVSLPDEDEDEDELKTIPLFQKDVVLLTVDKIDTENEILLRHLQKIIERHKKKLEEEDLDLLNRDSYKVINFSDFDKVLREYYGGNDRYSSQDKYTDRLPRGKKIKFTFHDGFQGALVLTCEEIFQRRDPDFALKEGEKSALQHITEIFGKLRV
jgi:hypothetical protein